MMLFYLRGRCIREELLGDGFVQENGLKLWWKNMKSGKIFIILSCYPIKKLHCHNE